MRGIFLGGPFDLNCCVLDYPLERGGVSCVSKGRLAMLGTGASVIRAKPCDESNPDAVFYIQRRDCEGRPVRNICGEIIYDFEDVAMRLLFIGGANDGEWLNPPSTEFVRLPKRTAPQVVGRSRSANPVEEVLDCELYRRERIGNFDVFLESNLSHDDAIQLLLKGYSP